MEWRHEWTNLNGKYRFLLHNELLDLEELGVTRPLIHSTHSYGFISVQTLSQFSPSKERRGEEQHSDGIATGQYVCMLHLLVDSLEEQFLDLWHSCPSSHQYDRVNLMLGAKETSQQQQQQQECQQHNIMSTT